MHDELDELECAPTQECTQQQQQQQQVRRRAREQFTVYNQAKSNPIQPYVFKKEKGRVQQRCTQSLYILQ